MVNGDEVGVRIGRLGAARLAVDCDGREYRLCLSVREPLRECKPLCVVICGGDGGNVIFGSSSSLLFAVELCFINWFENKCLGLDFFDGFCWFVCVHFFFWFL